MGIKEERKMTAATLFKLLPTQILLSLASAANGFISSYFASNYVGVSAMGAVGLFFPLMALMIAIGMMLMSGSVVLCGKYMGQNDQEKLNNAFSMDIMVSVAAGCILTALFLAAGLFGLTGFLTSDPVVRPIFNRYLMGQAAGAIPLILGNQLMSFLSLENKPKYTTAASVVCVAVNFLLDMLFLKVLHMEVMGLAIANALAMWAMVAVELHYYLSGKSIMKFSMKNPDFSVVKQIVMTGLPGAASQGYQALRALIVNRLLEIFVGAVGVSALAAVNNYMSLFFAIPVGMQSVSRMLMSVSIGEEDRRTLTNVMFVMFAAFVPIMCAVVAVIIMCADPLTMFLFRDPADPVYGLTVSGLRILPICMPFSLIVMHFMSYDQAMDKKGILNIIALLDGVVCVAGFTALLIRPLGMNSVYVANILNGVVTVAVIVIYACIMNRHFPRNLEELMVIPADFGAPEDMRIDISVESMEDVVTVARRIHYFALERGVDRRRAYCAALAMEEMAGLIVTYGFPLDRQKNTISVRVAYKGEVSTEGAAKSAPMRMMNHAHKRLRLVDKDGSGDAAVSREESIATAAVREGSGAAAVSREEVLAAGQDVPADDAAVMTGDVIMRIKDNCKPYDLRTVEDLIGDEDKVSNIGVRMVMQMAKKVEYQNILGLNALTIRI